MRRWIWIWMEEQGGGGREEGGSRVGVGVAESLYYTSIILYSATEIDTT